MTVTAILLEPKPEGATSTTPSEGRYRSKIEVLRDLLEAARHGRCKTRIIGRANLNEESFARYAVLALSEGLLERVDHGFRATPLAEEWLGRANLVLAKRAELANALEVLGRVTDPARGTRSSISSHVGDPWSLRLSTRLSGTDLTFGTQNVSGGNFVPGHRPALSLSHATSGLSVGVVAEAAPETSPPEARGRRKGW